MSKQSEWRYFSNDSGNYLMKPNWTNPDVIMIENEEEIGELLASLLNKIEKLEAKEKTK